MPELLQELLRLRAELHGPDLGRHGRAGGAAADRDRGPSAHVGASQRVSGARRAACGVAAMTLAGIVLTNCGPSEPSIPLEAFKSGRSYTTRFAAAENPIS